MEEVLRHPFFRFDDSFEAPPLKAGEKNHVFLSHFQGNAARSLRQCTLKPAPSANLAQCVAWRGDVSVP